MSERSKGFPKELMNSNIESHNINWIKEYRQDTNHKESYYQSLGNIFKYDAFSSKPFSSFALDDLNKYIEVMIDCNYGDRRILYTISIFSSFKNYLIEKHPDIFVENFLRNIKDLTFKVRDNKYDESKSLNFIQINLVHEFLQLNLKTEYIFEIFYQLGIPKKDFNTCLPEYADMQDKKFKCGIEYTDKIQELLLKIKKVSNFSVKYGMITDHLKKIEDFLRSKGMYKKGKTLTYKDLQKTHEAFFVKCPNCGRTFENLSEYWVLAKSENSTHFRIVCHECKGEPSDEFNED
jgi:hypothetical protein